MTHCNLARKNISFCRSLLRDRPLHYSDRLDSTVGEGFPDGWRTTQPIIWQSIGRTRVSGDPTKFKHHALGFIGSLEGVNGVTGVLDSLPYLRPCGFSRDNREYCLRSAPGRYLFGERTQYSNLKILHYGFPHRSSNALALFGTLDAALSRCERNQRDLTFWVCDLTVSAGKRPVWPLEGETGFAEFASVRRICGNGLFGRNGETSLF